MNFSINNTRREKLCFIQFSTRIASWLLSIARIKSTDVWKMWILKQTLKMNGCCFKQDLLQNLGRFLSSHWKRLFLKGFVLKPTERAKVLLKHGSSKDRHVYVLITKNFERFQYFNFETDFLENENRFQKTGVPFFSWKHWAWTRIIFMEKYHIRSQY